MDTSTGPPSDRRDLLATTRYLQALTVLDDESVRRPSRAARLDPGARRRPPVPQRRRASRGCSTQAAAGEPASMYASHEPATRDIEETVARPRPRRAASRTRSRPSRRLDRGDLAPATADPATPYTRVPGGEPAFAAGHASGRGAGPRSRSTTPTSALGYTPPTGRRTSRSRVVKQRQDELAALPTAARRWCSRSTDVDGLVEARRGPGPGDPRHRRRPGLVAGRPRRRARADLRRRRRCRCAARGRWR